LNHASRLFDAARAAVAEDAVLTQRVEVARMPVDYVWLVRYASLRDQAEREGKPFRGPDGLAAGALRFIQAIRSSDTTVLKRGVPLPPAKQVERLITLQRHSASLPVSVKGLPPGRWFDLQDEIASVQEGGRNELRAEYIRDGLASDGVAVRVPNMWSIQLHLDNAPGVADLTGKRATVLASIRVETDVLRDLRFTGLQVGMYDKDSKQSAVRKYARERTTDTEYRDFEIGSFELTSGMYFYAGAIGPGADANPPVLVDRFFIVMQP
jgi:hypothetical protein